METRSNRLLVLAVIGILLASLIAFSTWLFSATNPAGREYLIQFNDSVAGIEKGSSVNYSGVPVGAVTSVRLTAKDPASVFVTVRLDPEVPILQGVKASITRSLVGGAATITLDGSQKGAPPIVSQDDATLPVIPARKGGLIGSGGDPMATLERISRTVDKVSGNLDSRGQERARERLAALAASSTAWPGRATRISDSLKGARGRISRFGISLDRAGDSAHRLSARMKANPGGQLGSADKKLRSAQQGIEGFERSVSAARPSIRAAETRSEHITAEVRSLRGQALGIAERAEQIDQSGLRFGAPKLPNFKKKKHPHVARRTGSGAVA